MPQYREPSLSKKFESASLVFPPLLEIWHDGGFLVSEANGHRSRDGVTVTGGVKVFAGRCWVRSRHPAMAPLNPVAADGTEIAAAILFGTRDASAADCPGVAITRAAEVTRVYAMCGDAFYDAFVNHPDVIRTFIAWSDAKNLSDNSQGAAFDSFDFSGIRWFNYRGSRTGWTRRRRSRWHERREHPLDYLPHLAGPLSVFAAGIAGALARVVLVPPPTRRLRFAHLVTGALAALFVAPAIDLHWFSVASVLTQRAVAFVTGAARAIVVEIAIRIIEQRGAHLARGMLERITGEWR